MNRRDLLKVMGAGTGTGALAGCVLTSGDSASGVEMSISKQYEVGDDSPLRYDVEMTQQRLDHSNYPGLELVIENVVDVDVGMAFAPTDWERAGFFGSYTSRPKGLVIGLRDRIDDSWFSVFQRSCLRSSYGRGTWEEGVEASESGKIMEAGEKYSWDLGIMGDADFVDSCPPPGEYQFTPAIYEIQTASQEEYADNWDGFVVKVE